MAKPRGGREIVALETGYRFTVGGTMATTSDGRVLLLTSGPETFGARENFAIGRAEMWESRDHGRSWHGPQALHRGTDDSLMLPVSLLRLASGRILLLEALYGGYDFATHDPAKSLLEFHTQFSDDDGRTWSRAERMEATWRYVNAPLGLAQLSTGRVLIPSGYLTPHGGRSVVSALYSDDDARTWHRSASVLDAGGDGFESGACEPTVAELPEGRVWMLMRTQLGAQWESFSGDGGVTWGEPRPTWFPSSSAPATLLRLRDGRIVVAWCNSVAAPYARHSLVVAVSDDGGRSFGGFREIAHVDAPVQTLDRRWGVAYPFLCEAADGTLLVAFNNGDWKHMRLKVARLDPDWIGRRGIVEDFSDGLGDWCGVGTTGESLSPTGDDAPGAALQIDWVAPGPCGMSRNFPLVVRGRMECALTVLRGPAFLLWHQSFLDPGATTDACLRVRLDADGNVHVGSGTPTRRTVGKASLSPEYSYTAYPVAEEVLYPRSIRFAQGFNLAARVDTPAGVAWVSIDGGPAIARPLAGISGLCYFGLAVETDGAARLRRLETHS